MSKIEFKAFIKKHPQFVNYVEKGEVTWQKLYELYDLYGEESSIWNKYLNTVQKGLVSLDKAIDAFKDILPKNTPAINNYEPRPTYKYFED